MVIEEEVTKVLTGAEMIIQIVEETITVIKGDSIIETTGTKMNSQKEVGLNMIDILIIVEEIEILKIIMILVAIPKVEDTIIEKTWIKEDIIGIMGVETIKIMTLIEM